ncbi:aminotransferase class I/II-fold pyridoxal phosphate-dependent enzyme [Streptomyces asoensis]
MISRTTSSVSGAVQVSPFLAPSRGGLYRRRRTSRPGEVNLKSTGLLDPRAAALHRRTLQALDPVDVLTYPVLGGVYTTLAARMGVAPESLVLTAGSDPGLGLLVRAFPTATRIVTHHPTYQGWDKFAHLGNCRIDGVPPDPDTGRFALADLGTRLEQGPPAFVVVTQPHSLTGQFHEADELAALADTVTGRGSLLVVDTAYLAFTDGGEELVRDITGRPGVVRVNSFSKCYGLSGARIGVIATDPETACHLFDIDAEGSVSATALALLDASLRRHDDFEEIWADVRRLRSDLARRVEECRPGWLARPSGANFVTFDVPGAAEAAAATAFLYDQGYVVRDLSGLPSLPAAVRIAVADHQVVDRVVELLGGWRHEPAG